MLKKKVIQKEKGATTFHKEEEEKHDWMSGYKTFPEVSGKQWFYFSV